MTSSARRRVGRLATLMVCGVLIGIGVPAQAVTPPSTADPTSPGASTTAAPADAGALAGPTADQLRAAAADCGTQLSNGNYAERSGGARTVPVCGNRRAVFYKSGMTIDCDGQRTAECNENTDPWFYPATACVQSDGDYLVASELPYIVVPVPSSIWDSRDDGVNCGTVVAVVYGDRVVYGVVGDRGPNDAAGEGSYRLAAELGINPDPRVGGVSGRVVDYIFFPGTVASPLEDHADAVAKGEVAANAFVSSEPSCAGVTIDFADYAQLAEGASGAQVRAAQCLLRAAGHDPGGIDGNLGPATRSAVIGYQNSVGLPATGTVDSHTWTALLARGTTPLLRNGSSGAAVRRLQRALTAALDRTVGIDGQFGPITERAVRDYQTTRQLDVDGVVGPLTWGALQTGQ